MIPPYTSTPRSSFFWTTQTKRIHRKDKRREESSENNILKLSLFPPSQGIDLCPPPPTPRKLSLVWSEVKNDDPSVLYLKKYLRFSYKSSWSSAWQREKWKDRENPEVTNLYSWYGVIYFVLVFFNVDTNWCGSMITFLIFIKCATAFYWEAHFDKNLKVYNASKNN